MAPVTWRAEAIVELAVSAIKVGDFDKAAALCLQAIKVKPEFAEAFHIRGVCELRLDRPMNAILHFERSLDLKVDQYDCWNNLGIAFAEIGLWEQARTCFEQSLARKVSVEPHVMCGGMFAHMMKLEAAENEFRAALAIEPQNQDARLKFGVLLLGQGKWKEGFENYQWRWFDTPHPPRPYRMFPKWQGESLEDKTILLYSEQGFGDEILALRFVRSVLRSAPEDHPGKGIWWPKRVITEVRPTMARLCQNSNMDIITHGDPYETLDIDYSCPLLDVPMVLGLTPETMPTPKRYLYPLTGFEGEWPKRLAHLKGFKVGVCWSSGRRPLQTETQKSMAAKSLLPVQLLPWMDIEGVDFVSLQIPREPIPRELKVHDFTDHIDDFFDTAQLIHELDLIISVDTAVAHLAGALGKPVWNLVRFNGYWPWMNTNVGFDKPTVWYPSMRTFWQPELGQWDPVISEVRERLIMLADGVKPKNQIVKGAAA